MGVPLLRVHFVTGQGLTPSLPSLVHPKSSPHGFRIAPCLDLLSLILFVKSFKV